MNRVGTVHEFEAILWTVRDPDTALLKLILAGTSLFLMLQRLLFLHNTDD